MKLSDVAKKMVFAILIIALISIIASIIYYRSIEFIPFLLGVLLGAACSVLKVFLLDRTVDKALSMKEDRIKGYTGLQHLARLLLTGIALFLGAVVPQVSLWGVVAGVFAFQLAVYTVRFTTKG